MKRIESLVIVVMGLVLMLGVTGCQTSPIAKGPPQPTTIQTERSNELAIDKKHATFSFEQDGKTVEGDDKGVVRLKAKTFTIRLTGDKQDVSLLTVRDEKLLESLKKHPTLVTSTGGYQACPDTELLITDKELHVCGAEDTKKLQQYWIADRDEAEKFAGQLKKAMGGVPTLLSTGRQCLKEDNAEAFNIANLVVDNKERAIQAGDSLEVLIFLDSPLIEGCNKSVWKSVRLIFGEK